MPSAYKGYVVHEDGRVWRPERVTTRRDGVRRKMKGGYVATRIRKCGKGCGGGYVYIDLSVEGESGHLTVEHWLLHRLVAVAFLGFRTGMEVNHKDGDRANNALSNLEWVTHSDNQKHAYRTGVRSDVGENSPRAKVSDADAREIARLRNSEGVKLIVLAERFGISFQSISRIAKGGHHAVIAKL